LVLVRTVILVAAIAFLVAGTVSCIRGKGHSSNDPELVFGISMGIAFLSSGFLALALLYIQNKLDDAAEEERDAQSEVLREENYRLSLQLAADLTGFDPGNHDIDGINFGGKILKAAQLTDKELHHFAAQDAVLVGAELEGASLTDANLIGADISEAELMDANLSNADLRNARFEHAAIENADSLKGAKVNGQTCWPQAFLESSDTWWLALGLVSPRGDDAPPVVPAITTAEIQRRLDRATLLDGGDFGHTCNREPATIIRCTVRPEADGSLVAVPPAADARVKDIEWPASANGPDANVTWIIEPPSGRAGGSGC
jgi:hypothetical protein